jgi:hypothetical protein
VTRHRVGVGKPARRQGAVEIVLVRGTGFSLGMAKKKDTAHGSFPDLQFPQDAHES